jgi:hypothetical protein
MIQGEESFSFAGAPSTGAAAPRPDDRPAGNTSPDDPHLGG